MPAKKPPAATPAPVAPASAWLLRIELRDLEPVIWREVWVDPAITLRRLHGVIQAAMGWENCHLYGFAVPGSGREARFWGVPPERRYEPPEAHDDFEPGEPAKDDARTKLRQVMAAPRDKLLYLYDFGDDCEHLVTLKQIGAIAEPLPFLAAGVFAGPPEDCGGPGGFMHLAEVLSNPRDPEHADLREWADGMKGPDWVPGELSEAAFRRLAAAVAKLRPRARAAKKAG